MPTYRLTIEYDGTRYHGWQGQALVRTVSGELRRAIEDLIPVIDLGGAGRTDAGVHAQAQIAHLRVQKSLDAEQFRRDVNDRLPADIHVLAVEPAAERFHARHDAVSRSYIYQVSTRRTAFAKRFVWWVRGPLDLAEMRQAAAAFVGRHDFRRFCEKPAEQPSTLVEVERIELVEQGDLLLLRFVASHFLWKMVRRMVGTLVRVGAGELTTRELEDLLDAKLVASAPGSPAEWTAPAAGLFLERVRYQGEPALPALTAALPVRSHEPMPQVQQAEAERRGRPEPRRPAGRSAPKYGHGRPANAARGTGDAREQPAFRSGAPPPRAAGGGTRSEPARKHAPPETAALAKQAPIYSGTSKARNERSAAGRTPPARSSGLRKPGSRKKP